MVTPNIALMAVRGVLLVAGLTLLVSGVLHSDPWEVIGGVVIGALTVSGIGYPWTRKEEE